MASIIISYHRVWNTIPTDIRELPATGRFKKKLKSLQAVTLSKHTKKFLPSSDLQKMNRDSRK